MPMLQSLEDIQTLPQSSLSQTPFFNHILSSLPSLRTQIKEAVTASTNTWLLEIRNVSGEVGRLALEAMELRTRKWRARREKEALLKLSRVGSSVEMVTNEKLECERSINSVSPLAQRFNHHKMMSLINCRSISSHCISQSTYILRLIRWKNCSVLIKLVGR